MIVADASSIISLVINCMSGVLHSMNAKIVTTPAVYDEIFTKPIKSKRFVLEALRIKRLFSHGVISIMDDEPELTHRILNISNSVFSVRGKPLKILHKGEAAALSLIIKSGADAFLIDERTTRLLIEDPDSLMSLLSHRNKEDVKMDDIMLSKFFDLIKNTKIIRSTEIAARAYEMGLLDDLKTQGHNVLDATLYALKLSGCAISWEEIEEYKAVLLA